MATDDRALPNLSRRALLRFALVAPLASGAIAAPSVPTSAVPEPVRPHVFQRSLGPGTLHRLDPEKHRAESSSPTLSDTNPADIEVFGSGALDVGAFGLAALTWIGVHRPDVSLLVRTRERNGRWSGWTRLTDDDHGPDSLTAEALRARRGTDPIITDPSDRIEVRMETTGGFGPDDLRLELVEPSRSPADAATGITQTGTTPEAPTILRRADWGADESVRESGDPSYGQVRGAFVHHTAGSNSYTSDDVPGIIRSIYAYHVKGRGWRDIGYNFLVDRFGRIWEGRFGGIDRPVVGAHAAGYNYYAFGTSLLGTYVNNEPESEALRGFERVIAWKFDIHGVDPRAVSYPDLTDVPAIAGHRDGGATQCPGDRLYDQLSTIRGGVARRLRP